MGSPHLCLMYVATAGLQGNLLGSDEEEVVLLIYVIIDMAVNKVVGVQQYLVKPAAADINENVLSEQLVEESALTEELVKNAGQPLESAIRQFDLFVRSLQIDPKSPLFRFVTDGQLPLRQCLHPEACSKDLELPSYYYMFHDLRKDFRAFYSAPDEQELNSIMDLVNYLGMPHDRNNSEFYVKETKDMVNIVQRLIADGHCFSTPETIDAKLEPGICLKDDEVDNNCVVRARGLPWQSSDQDVAKFFRGLNITKGGVALCLSAHGRRNGEALVRFVSQEHRDMALKRHKHHIGNRYIEVYKASGEDFIQVTGGGSYEAVTFLTKGAQVIVRMRGLPYDCTAKQVVEFFEAGENTCSVMGGVEGVMFVRKPDGRATGDAFVLFAKEEDSAKALSKHRELIGTRYIELFRSTIAEVQQVLNRSNDPKVYEPPPPPPPLLQTLPLLPQHIITSGTRKDCIRLRGLPYEARVEHILEFLGEHAKNIVFQGVHMVYNAHGQPSGEAFIQMDSEGSAFLAAQQKHHRYMFFGKKQRYIEVFQCSGEDMNLVLTGGLPVPPGAVSPVAKTLLSPGMLTPPPSTPAPTAAWDPIMAAAVQVQQAQAIAQFRQSQQEGLWLMNQLALAQQAQHQQQALAVALAKSQPQWSDLNGSLIQTASLPPPPSVSVATSMSMQTASPITSKPHFSFPTTHYLPAQFAHPPMFFLNMPPRMPPPSLYPKVQPPPMQAQYALPPLSIIPPPTAPPPQSMINLKRSWEQAFPNAVAAEANAAMVKRSYPPTSSAQSVYVPPTVPPPPPPQTVAYQTQQYYSTI